MRRSFLGVLALLVATGPLADSSQIEIPVAEDLHADAAVAESERIPIMLLVSQTYCGYCDQLKEWIIRPMILSGDYEGKVTIRELLVDSFEPVRDFDGEPRDPDKISARYEAHLTPTLLFLGPDGQELTERIHGINTPEMFGHYVDEAIAKSTERLRASD
jgi:thioredoxin-related protein